MEKQRNHEISLLSNILINARMVQIRYGEIFSLIFSKVINNKNVMQDRKMILMIDSPFWVGKKEEFLKLDISNSIGMEDTILAQKLVELRYWNLIDVQKVDIVGDCLYLELFDGNVLLISNYADSDFSWILEDLEEKSEQEKMTVFCQENEITFYNITDFVSGSNRGNISIIE